MAGGRGHVLTVPHIVVDGDRATGRGHALNIRWDADAGRFWVARVSANTWRRVRTPHGWRIAERVNANLDGTAGPREMLAPPGAGPAEA
ncbi:nuclear transport factor 2 family protein [Spirillospora sp. CA-255316]